MPFDGKEVQFETPALRRARLIEALRGEMSNEFVWDFTTIMGPCGTSGCALGLACKLWPDSFDTLSDPWAEPEQGEFFGISEDAARRIFYDEGEFYGVDALEDVTPAMVADALEKIG